MINLGCHSVEDDLPEWQEFCRYIEANLLYLCICYKNK